MTEKELTWIATVFDCEGSLTAQKYQGRKIKETLYPMIQIGNTQREIIERFHNLVGFGKVYYDYEYNKTQYELASRKDPLKKRYNHWWKATNFDDCQHFIHLIWNEWISPYRRKTAFELGLVVPEMMVENSMNGLFIKGKDNG